MLPDDERISWKEAERVVRLHRLRCDYPVDVPVASLARALDVDVSEVTDLLAQSRGERKSKRLFTDRSGLVSAALAAGIAIAVLAAAGLYSTFSNTSEAAAPSITMSAPIEVTPAMPAPTPVAAIPPPAAVVIAGGPIAPEARPAADNQPDNG